MRYTVHTCTDDGRCSETPIEADSLGAAFVLAAAVVARLEQVVSPAKVINAAIHDPDLVPDSREEAGW